MADSELVKDLRVNPLMLSLMCGIYASEHYIPRNRPDVYEKCALLLFDMWDKQRGVKPALSFDAHVQAAMRSLALWLYPQQLSRQGLPRAALVEHMKSYLLEKRFDNEEDAENAAVEFVDFCKGRAWVLTDVGAELYGFTHRTFLEYFAASQIVRENTDPTKLFEYLVERLRTGGWEVVAQLALQILNKAVEDGADNFLEILLDYTDKNIELRLKWKLIAFATQSLTYIVPRPTVLRSLTTRVINFVCSQPGIPHLNGNVAALLSLLFGAAPENLPLIAKYTFDQLATRLMEDVLDNWALGVALNADSYAIPDAPRTEYEVSNNNRQFWSQQCDLQAPRFQSAAEAQKRKYSWVAVYLLERGLSSIDEVLAWFGPAALYGSLPEGKTSVSRELPLAARIFLHEIGIFGERTRLDRVDIKLTQHGIDEIKDALLRLSTPWFTATESMLIGAEIMTLALDEISFRYPPPPTYRRGAREINGPVTQSPPGALSALLFFAATLSDIADMHLARIADRYSIELAQDAREVQRQRAVNLVHSMLLSRALADNKDTQFRAIETTGAVPIAREALSTAGVDEPTASVLERWISDAKFRFIKGFRRRRPWLR